MKLYRISLLQQDRLIHVYVATLDGAGALVRRVGQAVRRSPLPAVDTTRARVSQLDLPRPEADRLLRYGWGAAYGGPDVGVQASTVGTRGRGVRRSA